MKNKKNNYLKRFIAIAVFISLITQINIFVTDGIKKQIKQQKIEKDIMLCPPDCCKLTNEEDSYQVPELPNIEILDIDVEPIKKI